MEKYCKNCGRVFDDLNFKLCPYCGSELAIRYGRQPIPRKLRHEVFKRDGYRCRECGASKDETSLEIDHIIPVAKGGTNDIDNLQTLCKECNRMKHTDEWVGGETDLEVAENELRNLEEQLQKANERLNNATNDYEILDYKFKVVKLNDDIDEVKDKIESLIKVSNEKEKELLISQELEEAKQIAYKKLYINLDKKSVKLLSDYFNIPNNKSDVLKHAVNYVVEEEIFNQLYEKFDLDFFNKNKKIFLKNYYISSEHINELNSIEDIFNEVKEFVTEEEFFNKMNNEIGFDEWSKAINVMNYILRDAGLSLSLEKGIIFPINFLKEELINISIVGRVCAISGVLTYDVPSDGVGESYQFKEKNLLLKDNINLINVAFSNPSSLTDVNIGDLIQINNVQIDSCSFKDFKSIYNADIFYENCDFCKSFSYNNLDIIEAKYNYDSSFVKLKLSHFPDSDRIIEEVNSIIDYQIVYEEEKANEEQRKNEEKQKEIEMKKQEEIRKEKLFNEFNSDLTNPSISFLSTYYGVENNSELINLLVDNFDSKEAIFEFINKQLSTRKFKSTKKLLMKSPVHIDALLNEIFNSKDIALNSRKEKIQYLAENYSERKLKRLITKSENKVINAKLKKINESRNKNSK